MPLHSSEEVLTRVLGIPKRVVSLVPSMTQSMLDLGLADHLVGITDFCPAVLSAAGPVVRCGGPKTLDLKHIQTLQPDLILANQEENQRKGILALGQSDLSIWLSFPTTVSQAMQDLWVLARLFHLGPDQKQRIESLAIALDWVQTAVIAAQPVRYFCPIWQQQSSELGLWWMTFNAATYAGDLLRICGGVNTFSQRQRRYPVEADVGAAAPEKPKGRDLRYPRVGVDEVISQQPDLVLLPNEPFTFSQADREQLQRMLSDTPAVRSGRIESINGRLITWHGTYVGKALAKLPAIMQRAGIQA